MERNKVIGILLIIIAIWILFIPGDKNSDPFGEFIFSYIFPLGFIGFGIAALRGKFSKK